jgi:hypothetical protein
MHAVMMMMLSTDRSIDLSIYLRVSAAGERGIGEGHPVPQRGVLSGRWVVVITIIIFLYYYHHHHLFYHHHLLCCAVGISSIHESYPEVRIVTGEIDTGLNQQVSGVCYPSTYLPSELTTYLPT